MVQELGYAEDVDQDLRADIEKTTGNALVDDDHTDPVDVAVLWFREDDGDLTDALVDCIQGMEDGGTIWLCTPKTGREGHVETSDIGEAVTTAGLARTSSLNIAPDWAGTRIVSPKAR
ncbi:MULTISPECIES: DUF3052 domain-containing protein [unclassified Streptomyces]|uniref:DUF3052 domain-containing protein n=1 Tax=unclassified Streptomyces TaxID=2593676 RepID=UPI003654BCDE